MIGEKTTFRQQLEKLQRAGEEKRLKALQAKYPNPDNIDYGNMNLRDELQTRFDLDEMNNLQQKYKSQQTSLAQPQITTNTSGAVDKSLNTIKQKQSPIQQIVGAIGDMSSNYFDMKKDNTINGDDYFHCKANYEAASRGDIGAKTAKLLEDVKENYWDYWDNQFRKGLTRSQADLDKRHDKRVNKIGRQRAQSGLYSDSRDACNSYRVNGINDKY